MPTEFKGEHESAVDREAHALTVALEEWSKAQKERHPLAHWNNSERVVRMRVMSFRAAMELRKVLDR